MPTSTQLSFDPKLITKELLSLLNPRSKEVLNLRYGLGRSTSRYTLEGIGRRYGITRERVRQIENQGIRKIKKSEMYASHAAVFDELKGLVQGMGGIIAEKDLLDSISANQSTQNHVHFLLVLGDHFVKYKEDDHFHNRWQVDDELSDKIHESLKNLYSSLSDEDLLAEPDLVKRFLNELRDVSEEYKQDEIARRWLAMSKKLAPNPLGEWGKVDSSNVTTKGVRDYAYLVIRKHGSPIHFREVARAIEKEFNVKAHEATTHNELIKDPRFVLVGRGLYALDQWGYSGGVVRDVIRHILEKHGPLTKKEVVDKVLKERYVKENTILVNLQNPRYFWKDEEGRYHIKKTDQ